MSIVWQATTLNSGSNQDAGQTPGGGLKTGEVCIPNISISERRKRLAGGVIGLVICLGVLAMLMTTGADRGWRLILLPLLWGAAVGFFQWRAKT